MVFDEIVEIHVARMGYCGKISFSIKCPPNHRCLYECSY